MENEIIKETITNTPVVVKSNEIGRKIGFSVGCFVAGVISTITFQEIRNRRNEKKNISLRQQEREEMWYEINNDFNEVNPETPVQETEEQ